MKKHLLAAAAVAALGSAAPASAQVGNIIQQGIQGLLGGSGISARLATLESQISMSFQRGEISQGQASRLQNELLQLRETDRVFRIDGLSRAERSELQQRLQNLERRIQRASFDRNDRFDRDDRFDDDNDQRFGRNVCPPGLAKKDNGCMPPGQAKKGNRGKGKWDEMRSGDVRTDRRLQDTDQFVFRQDGNRVLQIDRRTGQVVRVIDRRR